MLQRNYYAVLGLPNEATAIDIKQKYRELARKYHPDLVKDKAFGQRIFTQINQAYRTLGDSERRSKYDASLRAPGSGNPAAPTIVSASQANRQINNGLGTREKPNVDDMVRAADDAMMRGQVSKAHFLSEAILKIDPENAKTLGILGDALLQLKRTDQALAAYRKSLSIAQTSIILAKLSRLESVIEAERTKERSQPTKAVSPGGNGRMTQIPARNFFRRSLAR
jgi:curved DNA-binding protein CbpA